MLQVLGHVPHQPGLLLGDPADLGRELLALGRGDVTEGPQSRLTVERGQAAGRTRPRTAQSFCVPKAEIAAQGYDLSLNRYKEVVHEEVAHRPPREILAELARLEEEIQAGMRELVEMLG